MFGNNYRGRAREESASWENIPRVLFGAKMAKSLKKKDDNFNENIFKNFWEAEGRQVSLATATSSRFHENVEALKVDPGYENYNFVKR